MALVRLDPRTLAPSDGKPRAGGREHVVVDVAASEDAIALAVLDVSSAGVPDWSVVAADLPSGDVAVLASGDDLSPLTVTFTPDGEAVDWLVPARGDDPNFSDGFTVRRAGRDGRDPPREVASFDRGRLAPRAAAFVDGGRVAAAFGVEDPENQGVPRVVAVDVASGDVLADVVLDLAGSSIERGAWVTPAWDPAGARAYVPHLDTEAVTVVDLRGGATETRRVREPRSVSAWLRGLWEPRAAYAKAPASHRSAALSPDGRLLYLSGSTVERPDGDGSRTRETPAGVVAVDTGTFEAEARSDLEIDQLEVAPAGDAVLAAGSWQHRSSDGGVAFGSSGLHLLDARTLERRVHVEASSPAVSYELAFSPDGRWAYGLERGGPYASSSRLVVIDVREATVQESRTGPARPWQPQLLRLGYALDSAARLRSPRTGRMETTSEPATGRG